MQSGFESEALELWDFGAKRGGYARPLAYALDHVDGTLGILIIG
jgi:hypothetical protein